MRWWWLLGISSSMMLSACAKEEALRYSQMLQGASVESPVLNKYQFIDPNHEVPDDLLKAAVASYDANLSKLGNTKYLTVVDFSAHASRARFFIVNMATGAVTSYHVAHGRMSDPKNTGYATSFSNTINSDKSSLGVFFTDDAYYGNDGYSLHLDGQSSTNSNARARDIVIHGATYVYDSNEQAGRSLGCFALPMDDRTTVIDELKGGSLLYAGLSND